MSVSNKQCRHVCYTICLLAGNRVYTIIKKGGELFVIRIHIRKAFSAEKFPFKATLYQTCHQYSDLRCLYVMCHTGIFSISAYCPG